MIKNLQLGDINKLKRYIPFDINNSSKIYKEKDILHKIPYSLNKKIINNLKYIDENNIKYTIKITNFIEDNNNIVGYSVKRYSDYKSLTKYKKRQLQLKLMDCFKLISIFKYFNNKDLIYHDFHTGNILLNDNTNDIKICDLDTFTVSSKERAKKAQLGKTLELCVSYLYNVDPYESDVIINHSPSKIDADNYIKDCFKAIGTDEFEQKVKQLEKIDFSTIRSDRRRIKDEASEYFKKGYLKIY